MAETPNLSIDETRLQRQVMGDLVQFARGFTSTVSSTAKGMAPVRTGRLKTSIRPDAVRRVGPWSIESGVSATAPYAAPVHEGARPHVIRPRRAKALRFEIGGRVVFAARVNHPGNRPNRFLSNAAHRVASADPRIRIGG